PVIAANRGLEAKQLRGLLRGELDWIVMKCLEKDRNRRYDTANSLARDLQRYLADQPVTACPPSAWYRRRKFVRRHRTPGPAGGGGGGYGGRKFVRRHRTPVLAVGLVVLALLVGIAGTTWNWLDAEHARREAQGNAEAERKARQALEAGSYLRLIALANQRMTSDQQSDAEALLEECPPHLRQWEWYYLRRWYDGTHFVDLPLHTTPSWVRSVAFSPVGQRLAAALKGGAIKI